jgi:hypothetical protein
MGKVVARMTRDNDGGIFRVDASGSNGYVWATIAKQTGGLLQVFNSGGILGAELGSFGTGLHTTTGAKWLTFLGSSTTGDGYLTIASKGGDTAHEFGLLPQGAFHSIFNSKHTRVAALGVGSQYQGGALWLYDDTGANLVGYLGAAGDGSGGDLEIRTTGGALRHWMQASGTYFGYNPDGNRVIGLGPTVESHGGGIWLYDATGAKQVAYIGSGGTAGSGYLEVGGQAKDYAELFDFSSRMGVVPGSVVAASPDGKGVVLAAAAYEPAVVGVISGAGSLQTAMLVGSRNDGTNDLPVAVAGQVFVRISSEGGAVRVGDLLVASSTPGVAMRGADRERLMGAVVGKALEPYTGSGEGLIRMLVINH